MAFLTVGHLRPVSRGSDLLVVGHIAVAVGAEAHRFLEMPLEHKITQFPPEGDFFLCRTAGRKETDLHDLVQGAALHHWGMTAPTVGIDRLGMG